MNFNYNGLFILMVILIFFLLALFAIPLFFILRSDNKKHHKAAFIFYVICGITIAIITETRIGSLDHISDIKFLSGENYYSIEGTSYRNRHFYFTTISPSGEEREFISLNAPIIIYTDDKKAYADFKTYGDNNIAIDLVLYLPDMHCKNCGEEQERYFVYCSDCGEKTDWQKSRGEY